MNVVPNIGDGLTMGMPGSNESIVEVAAEAKDPALWAALQLTKEVESPPANMGEAIDMIRGVFRRALARAATIESLEHGKLVAAVLRLKELCHSVARGHTREDRIHKALEANRIAAPWMNIVATQEQW